MKNIIAISLLLLAVISCKKDDDEVKKVEKVEILPEELFENFKQVDLNTSDMLLYREINGWSIEVFSISTSGKVVKEYFPVGEDSLITDYPNQTMYSLNQDYFHLEFYTYNIAATFLVDKHTGATYPYTPSSTNVTFTDIQTDKLNNIYYINSEHQLVRTNLSDPQSVSEQIISFPEDYIYYFAVSPEGNVVYDGDYDNEGILRAVSSSGEIKSLPHTEDRRMPFLGTDGVIHYLSGLADDTEEHLFDVSFDPINTIYNTLAEGIPTYFYSTQIIKGKEVYVIESQFGLYHINTHNSIVSSIKYTDIDFDKLINIEVNDDFYYFAYQTKTEKFVLAKVEPVSGTLEKLIDGRFEVSNFAVKPDNTVYFKALDTQEFTSVIGKISPNKEITILAKDFSGDVTFIPLQ